MGHMNPLKVSKGPVIPASLLLPREKGVLLLEAIV